MNKERHDRVLSELHPTLRERLEMVLAHCDGRFQCLEGYRDQKRQETLFAQGRRKVGPSWIRIGATVTNAQWGQSPHNFKPSLAVDVVLNPERVKCRPHPQDKRLPDLWDTVSPDAMHAWELLEWAAKMYDLERVDLRKGVRDLPHLQLPKWREWVPN